MNFSGVKSLGQVGRNIAGFFTGFAKEGPAAVGGIAKGAGKASLWTADKALHIATMPLRAVTGVAAKFPKLVGFGALAAGGAMAYGAFSGRKGAEEIAPEMQNLQGQLVGTQQQLDGIAAVQGQQDALAQASAAQPVVIPAQAQPTTRLAVNNMAQPQGMVMVGGPQMVRA